MDKKIKKLAEELGLEVYWAGGYYHVRRGCEVFMLADNEEAVAAFLDGYRLGREDAYDRRPRE